MNYWGLKHVLRRQPRPQFLKWYKTLSWLFGSHDNPITKFSDQFRKIIIRYKRIGYSLNVMRQGCLVFNPITVNNYALLFNYKPGVRLYDDPDLKLLFQLVGTGAFYRLLLGQLGLN